MLLEKEKKSIRYAASSDGYFGSFDWKDIESRIQNCPQHIINKRNARLEEIQRINNGYRSNE